MQHPPVILTRELQQFLQDAMVGLCERGGWELRTCAAAPDHVHVLVDAPPDVHGQQVRELLKRWSTQALDTRWPRPLNGRWWAKGGSNKPVKDVRYLNRAFPYVHGQRV